MLENLSSSGETYGLRLHRGCVVSAPYASNNKFPLVYILY